MCKPTRSAFIGLLVVGIALLSPRSRAATLLFEDAFANSSLNRSNWNPYLCSNSTRGLPWHFQPGAPQPSSAIARSNHIAADYDLPSLIQSGDGLDMMARKGSTVNGYSWSGSVICSYPTSNAFGVTRGFIFTNGYVEVRAKMPFTGNGSWPLIWFLPAPGCDGAEINLHEGGYLFGSADPDHVMACNDNRNGLKLFDTSVSLSADFHTYALEYIPGERMNMYFDGQLAAAYTNNVSTGGYFIIINNGVASGKTSGWHSQTDESTPATNHLLVQHVRAYDSRPPQPAR